MVGGWDWGVAEEMEEADRFKLYFGDEISRVVTGKGLGPRRVFPSTVWNEWVLDFV